MNFMREFWIERFDLRDARRSFRLPVAERGDGSVVGLEDF